MTRTLNITSSDIVHHLKLSYQVPEIIEAIASQKIIQEAAQEAKITVTPEEIQQQGDTFRLTQKLVKAQDTLIWLEKHSLSEHDFEASVCNQILAQKLAHHLFASQVEQFFYQNQLDYVTAVTYEVIFNDKDVALEMFYAVEEGEICFPDIARMYIPEPELRCVYGYQGSKNRKDFCPEIAASVFAATPPQILKPIVTSKGVHLIWLEEILQPKLDEKLREKIISELFSVWLKKENDSLKIAFKSD
ncbi:peptidylprolyl isomerase [Anabaena subtropica]|uniref:Peptidylprolyl isomerase n=1 Tax=Anabaena subtropica FACHB-260 TaxID=2692884 RepID=A0ABR8CI34_9NOST|nr:peptidylprolyl isomerase [Anabaena subtropica]MBD2342901.1 peptidylprolyl isomerase [Anabaena subtropica FACHB-260]